MPVMSRHKSNAQIGIDVKMEGQLMLGVPKQLMLKTANDIMTQIALFGEADVKSQLWRPANYPKSRHGVNTGKLKRSIRGHLVKDFHGQIDPSGTYYAVYVEKGNGRGFGGYHMFATTRKKIKKKNWRKVVDKAIKRNLE
jgi:hypothetical protein